MRLAGGRVWAISYRHEFGSPAIMPKRPKTSAYFTPHLLLRERGECLRRIVVTSIDGDEQCGSCRLTDGCGQATGTSNLQPLLAVFSPNYQTWTKIARPRELEGDGYCARRLAKRTGELSGWCRRRLR